MQLNLLQEDLFSAAGETLTPSAPPKTKPSKSSAKAAAKETTPPAVQEEAPAVVAVAPAAPAPKLEVKPVEAAPIVAAPPAQPVATASREEPSAEALEKAPNAFKTISEVAEFLGLPQHVLRFWESRFSQIKPLKLRGGRRYYRPDDIEILSTIKHLLYKQGYTINGAKKAFSQGKNALIRDMHAQEAVQEAPAQAKTKISDKQKSQLINIRQELFSLRETLRPYTHA